MIKGIDISSWQGSNVDFKRVKNSGVEFVILRAGGSDGKFFTDPTYYHNYEMAKKEGLHIGAYYIVGKNCKSAESGLFDAQRFEQIIKNTRLDYPVYIDFELPDRSNKQGNTDACFTFCNYMELCGYYAGIYASDISGFKDRLYSDQLTMFDKWVARYGGEPSYITKYGIWQFTSKGQIDGINGNVDVDVSKNDYSKIIRENHLNGF